MKQRLFIMLSILLVGYFQVSAPTSTQAQTPTAEPTSQATAPAQDKPGMILDLQGALTVVHDPVMIKDGGQYYVFSTGVGIPIRCSSDMINWILCGRVFDLNPDWIRKAIPGVVDLWAPDISFFNNKFHLYYAGSTFGSNHSAIGLATNVTLDSTSPNYKWVDEGEVLESQRTDPYNAIDPNLAFDKDGQTWLAFGSFWQGIMMRKIDPATGKLAQDDPKLYRLANRGGVDAIEGAFIVSRGDYYYLFVSFDFCCRGVNSTYRMMVGRSAKITGPYIDRDNKIMLDGGGTLIYDGSPRWRGPGHNGIYIENGTYWLVYHSYDADHNGVPTLRIESLEWSADGWPSAPSAKK